MTLTWPADWRAVRPARCGGLIGHRLDPRECLRWPRRWGKRSRRGRPGDDADRCERRRV